MFNVALPAMLSNSRSGRAFASVCRKKYSLDKAQQKKSLSPKIALWKLFYNDQNERNLYAQLFCTISLSLPQFLF